MKRKKLKTKKVINMANNKNSGRDELKIQRKVKN